MSFTNYIDYPWALRYLAKSAKSQEEVDSWGFGEWCPKRTKNKGVRPGMSDDSISYKRDEGVTPPSERGRNIPPQAQRRRGQRETHGQDQIEGHMVQ